MIYDIYIQTVLIETLFFSLWGANTYYTPFLLMNYPDVLVWPNSLGQTIKLEVAGESTNNTPIAH